MGMHEQRPNLWVRRQSFAEVLPLSVVCGITIQPASANIFSLTCQPDIHKCPMLICDHRALLFLAVDAWSVGVPLSHQQMAGVKKA
jgi:hypothetical protein